MNPPIINEAEVDKIIHELLNRHAQGIELDINVFHDLLKHSLSLSTLEKKRVIDAVPTLSQYQFDELAKVFREEREKFRDLAGKHPEDIKKLLKKQQEEWLQLWDIYISALENEQKEIEARKREEEIKKSLEL